MKRTRILIADDHTMMCAGLKRLLQPEYEVVGSVADGRALIKATVDLGPDLVLVDVGMPLLNGLDAVRELKKITPTVKVIFLTMESDPDVASEALRVGASGYLLKSSEEAELLGAIRRALRGMSYVTPKIKRCMDETFIRDPKFLVHSRCLTDRQREVLQMLAEGRPMKEIADILAISVRTVKFHKYRIMHHLGTSSNAELVHYAIKHAVISPR